MVTFRLGPYLESGLAGGIGTICAEEIPASKRLINFAYGIQQIIKEYFPQRDKQHRVHIEMITALWDEPRVQ